MRVAVMLWLAALGLGCEHGLWLAGEAGDGSGVAEDASGVDDGAADVVLPPPPASPPWCPAVAAAHPCRPAALRRVAGEGRVAAVAFLDDGVALLLDSAADRGSFAHSQVALVRHRLDGSDERHEILPEGTEVGAAWTGTEFGVVVPPRSGGDATYLRVGLDGAVTGLPIGRRLCEELTWTGVDFRCLVTTTADVTWETLSLAGEASDYHQYSGGWVRNAAWGPDGPGVLSAGAGDWQFLRLAADGTPASPITRVADERWVGDSLLVAHGRDFLALFLRNTEDWGTGLVVAMGIAADGMVPRRPVVVDTIGSRSHVPSWGPVQFAASAAVEDTVVAYRGLELPAVEEDPTVARLTFRAITDDGLLGERAELSPTTDDNFAREWVTVARAGTGLVVSRSHSRTGAPRLVLDVWIGCCE